MNRAEHWSLVVVANLTSLMQRLQKSEPWTNLPEKLQPCIIYMDPLWKADRNIGTIVQLFLEAAIYNVLGEDEYMRKRFELTSGDFLINDKTIKDFQAIVPRQRNTSDCGLFVLEYLESFGSDMKAKQFLEGLFTKGHMVRWFPHSLISNKRVLLINIMMNYVNGLHISDCVEEYLSKKEYIQAVTADDNCEYGQFADTLGLDHEKIDRYYDNMPCYLEYKYSPRNSTNTPKFSTASPAFTEVE